MKDSEIEFHSVMAGMGKLWGCLECEERSCAAERPVCPVCGKLMEFITFSCPKE